MTFTAIFLASFLGSLLSLGLVGATVAVLVRRDIDRAKAEMQLEMNRGREMMAEFLATSAVEDSGSNETVQ